MVQPAAKTCIKKQEIVELAPSDPQDCMFQ